jgi:tRNA A-37 threonylcarbamoyl transferase component Bud32
VRFKRNGATIECLPAYKHLAIESLPWLELDKLQPQFEVVRTHPNQIVIRVPFEVHGKPERLYLKRYQFGDLRRRLKDALGRTRARGEWLAIHAVKALGIGVSPPILFGVRQIGFLRRESFLATREVGGVVSADAIIRNACGSERRRAVQLLGRLVGTLHARGLFHDDLKAPHILATAGRLPENGVEGVVLLDLYRAVTGRRPTIRQRGVNLAQAWISIPGLTRADQARLLEGALEMSERPDKERRKLWRSMQRAVAVRQRRRARKGLN